MNPAENKPESRSDIATRKLGELRGFVAKGKGRT